jgi:hypothetical protein
VEAEGTRDLVTCCHSRNKNEINDYHEKAWLLNSQLCFLHLVYVRSISPSPLSPSPSSSPKYPRRQLIFVEIAISKIISYKNLLEMMAFAIINVHNHCRLPIAFVNSALPAENQAPHLHHALRLERIKAAGGLVKEDEGGVRNELHGNVCAFALPATDATSHVIAFA